MATDEILCHHGRPFSCLECADECQQERAEWASAAAAGEDPGTPTGAEMIAAERQRQMSVEGWTPAHDDQHENGELLSAAVWYLDNGCEYDLGLKLPPWPWEPESWKPREDRIRQLVIAGALVAAEIDRLARAVKS